jgi:hypothetical protein
MDHRPGYQPSRTEGRLNLVTWFKGTPNTLNYGKYVAYLYYQGRLVADSAGGDKYGETSCEVTNTAYEESAFGYCRRKLVVNAMVWDKEPQFHPQDFEMYKNPGEYEIKLLQNGTLARTAKFTMAQTASWLTQVSARRTISARAASSCRCKSSAIRTDSGIATLTSLMLSLAVH